MGNKSRDLSLDEVLIGGREKREIVITDYDAGWPARFEAERVRVRRALGIRALRIEHIGSTAVPGLAAKPIIDRLVTVDDPEDDTSTLPALTSMGYELRVREPGHCCIDDSEQPRSNGTRLADSDARSRNALVRGLQILPFVSCGGETIG